MEEAHDVSDFSSGNDALDTWLRGHGLGNQRRYGVTYVATDDDGAVTAFVTVAPISVERKEVGATTGGPSRWPALLLGRMAVAKHLQGQKIGVALLRHVFELAVQQHYTTGCAAVVVDAKPDAVGFYAKHSFVESPTTKKKAPGDSTRMYISVETVLEAMRDPDATDE